MSASGLGVLMDEGLSFDMDVEGSVSNRSDSEQANKEEWRSIVTYLLLRVTLLLLVFPLLFLALALLEQSLWHQDLILGGDAPVDSTLVDRWTEGSE